MLNASLYVVTTSDWVFLKHLFFVGAASGVGDKGVGVCSRPSEIDMTCVDGRKKFFESHTRPCITNSLRQIRFVIIIYRVNSDTRGSITDKSMCRSCIDTERSSFQTGLFSYGFQL